MRARVQRALDVVLAAALVAAAAPCWALIAWMIKMTEGGPVLSRHVRVGRGFRRFRMLRFRTLPAGAADVGPAPLDAPLGELARFLRATHLDELPQLWNVLRGDMSLVGPRPPRPQVVERHAEAYRTLLQARPGLTDLAALAHLRLGLDGQEVGAERFERSVLPESLRLSRETRRRSSPAFDLWLLLVTAAAIVPGSRRLARLTSASRRVAPLLAAVAHAALVAAAHVAAAGAATSALPVVVGMRLLTLHLFGFHGRRWRTFSMRDARDLAFAVAISAVALGVLGFGPAATLGRDAALAIGLLVGGRIVRRMQHGWFLGRRHRRALVFASSAESVDVIASAPDDLCGGLEVVGAIAADAASGGRIAGVPVVGTLERLGAAIAELDVDVVVLGARSLSPADRAAAARIAAGLGVATLDALPAALDPETILGRAPLAIDAARIRERHRGRRALVSGASSAIGAALAHRLAEASVETLVLVDHDAELLDAQRDALAAAYPAVRIQVATASTLDVARREEIVAAAQPHVVVDARGTGEGHATPAVAHAALEQGAAFLWISSTRAATPDDARGRDARDTEAALVALAAPADATVACVRVPTLIDDPAGAVARLADQIQNGRPWTDHPQATRLLLTAAEAAGLALLALGETRGGQVFALDAGAPVRMRDVAGALLRREGLLASPDAWREFQGLASGERLDEIACGQDESAWRTVHPHVLLLGRYTEAPSAAVPARHDPASLAASIGFSAPDAAAAPELVGVRS